MEEEKWTTIAVKKSVSDKLTHLTALETIRQGKRVTKPEIIEKLIDKESNTNGE